MRDQKTSLKDTSRSTPPDRRSKSAEAPLKKPLQIPKKSSSVEGTSKKSVDPSSISKASEINHDDETAEVVMEAFDPSTSVGSVSPDLSFLSEITGDDGGFLLETCDSNKPGNSKIGFLEAKVSANLLTVARAEVLKSIDVNGQSVKLLERAIRNQVDGLNNPTGRIGEVASLNIHLFFFSLLLWILAMSVFFLFSTESQSRSFGPLPT